MKLMIKSPFTPLFFHQGIFANEQRIGHLAATNKIGQLKGNESYKVKIRESVVYVTENKRENGRRNWLITGQEDGHEKVKGSLTMLSKIADTLSDQKTTYEAEFAEEKHLLESPFMSFNGKSESFLLSEDREEIASLSANYFKKPLFRTEICIDIGREYTDLQIALFTVLLNIAIFL